MPKLMLTIEWGGEPGDALAGAVITTYPLGGGPHRHSLSPPEVYLLLHGIERGLRAAEMFLTNEAARAPEAQP